MEWLLIRFVSRDVCVSSSSSNNSYADEARREEDFVGL